MWRNNNRRKFGRTGLMAMLALMLMFMLVAAGCGKKESDEVLVSLKDGSTFSRSDFDKFIAVNKFFGQQAPESDDDPAFQNEMMNQYVMFSVLSKRANEEAKAEADKVTKEQLEQLKSMMDLQGGQDAILQEAGITMSDIEVFFRMMLEAFEGVERTISDKQIEEEYNKGLETNPNAYDVATVSHILIGTLDMETFQEKRTLDEARKLAEEVKAKLDDGADFAELAKQFSEDPGSKDNGGTYENANVNAWVPEFKENALNLPLNTISEPFKTDHGYHIMKVESRKTQTVEDLKPNIVSYLSNMAMYDFMENELPTLIEENKLPKVDEEPKGEEAPPADLVPQDENPAEGQAPAEGQEAPAQ